MPATDMNPDAPRWPEGNRSCVALAFDLDGPTGDAMLDGSIWNNPSYFTLGSYGPWRALGRLLDMLADRKVPATFFVPPWVVENWPKPCPAIAEVCHAIGYPAFPPHPISPLARATQPA